MHIRNQTSFTQKALYGMMSLAILISAFSAGSLPAVGAQQAWTATPQGTPLPGVDVPTDPIPLQMAIQFTPGTTEVKKLAYVKLIGAVVIERIDPINTFIVQFANEVSANAAPDSPIVMVSEPDYYVSALDDVIPNDPRYSEQWALTAIGAPSVWTELPADAPKVTVAVIDSGICASHPDLVGRIVSGYDFVQNDATPQDDFGHGCSVAGIIAANMNNEIGIAGIAPNAQVMPLRVLDASGVGSYSNVAAAIVYAVDHGAKVINLSLGGSNPSTTLENAVNYAIAKGIFVVAAAGNSGAEGVLYPAAYPDVIAVGSVDSNLQHSSFSNYGSQIDIWAPGRDILTTKRDGSYGLMSGTSFAAPYVAGTEVIYIALNKELAQSGSIVSVGRQTQNTNNTLTPEATLTQTPTSYATQPVSNIEWAHYTDRFYGYKVNYPINWFIDESSLDGWGGGLQLFSPNFDFNNNIETQEFSNTMMKVEIHAIGNPNNIVPSEFLSIQDQPYEYLGINFQVISSLDSQIAGHPAIIRTWQEDSLTGITYYVFINSTVYAIQKRPATSTYDPIFEEMLSGLQFPTQAVDGSIYLEPQEMVVPNNIVSQSNTPPTLKFPWSSGNSWYYTGGPHPFFGSSVLSGIDFSTSSSNKDLLATAAGKVTYLNWLDGSAGNTIKIDHGDGWESWYLHLASNSFNVQVNNQVPQGGFIAIAGGSGTGGANIHIHMDLRRYGQPQAWHGNTVDGWIISENCSGYLGSGCIVGSYNGYIEKSGRQVLPELSPSDAQLVQSSNVAIYQCFPLVLSASDAVAENTCGGGIATAIPPTQPPTVPPDTIDGLKLISVSAPTVQKGETFPVSITYEVVSGQLLESSSSGQHLFGSDPTYGSWPVQSIPGTINPGQQVTFSFNLTAPQQTGTFESKWQIKIGGVLKGPQAVVRFAVQDTTSPPTSSGPWNSQAWQNKYLAGYPNWEGQWTWSDNYPYVSFNWGTGAPFGWGGNEFSMRLWKTIHFPGGYYSFHASHDDGVKVYLDNTVILDAWWDGSGGHDIGKNIPAGDHEVKVEYYENTGDANVNVYWYGPGFPEPDTNPPDGRITSPANHSATGSSPLTITADASDDVSGVNRVEFYVWYCDGSCSWHLITTDYSAPYSAAWDWSALTDQSVQLTTHMIDNTGKVRNDPGGYVEVKLDRTKPAVSITSPVGGASLNGDPITITASASDSLSGVWKLQFFAGYVESAGAGAQSASEIPSPAMLGDTGELFTAGVSAQGWHEIGWDENGSDGWSLNWTPSTVPNQSGISIFAYAYDYAGNYQGTSISNLTLNSTSGGTGISCGQVSYNGVVFYEQANCNRDSGGVTKTFSSATGWIDIVSDPIHDKTSSIYVAPGWSAKIYEAATYDLYNGSYGGSWRCINGSMWDLGVDYYTNGNTSQIINNTISSVQVYNNSSCSDTATQNPQWKILALIYTSTDFTYSDVSGQHHVLTSMTQSEIDRTTAAVRKFTDIDIPALTSSYMIPTVTIRIPDHPLSTLSTSCGYWPNRNNTTADLDPAFDSVIVIWDDTGTDLTTGQPADLNGCGGLAIPNGTDQTYAAFPVDSVASNQQNVFKHEWGHSILWYFDAIGVSPKPVVDNHINSTTTQYVHCSSGTAYVLQDETDDNPIPNSIYNNSSGFAHDYYSGTTAQPSNPSACLGINSAAWSYGGPVTKSLPTIDLLRNGGFEEGTALPSWWSKDAWTMAYSTFTWDTAQKHSGSRSVKISNTTSNDARWIQTVSVQQNSDYRISGWIKTENVAHINPGVDAGANISILNNTINYTTPVFGTSQWTFVSMNFNSGSSTQVAIAARLGMYSGTTTGTAWFDDLKLELLSVPVCYTLSTSIFPAGSGSITRNPPPNCNNGTQYVHGTVVAVTANPVIGAAFANWSGTCSGNGACYITMDTAKSINASFNIPYTLTVSKAGTGNGAVISSPIGINCGADCSENYNYNTSVTLTAAPATGSTFTGWSGACTGTGSCVASMTAAKSVTANFILNTHSLAVSKTGTGSGIVSSNPTGINCGADCSENYNYNTSVTLTAASATGSTFTGWSGGVCTGIGSCVVSMTAAKSVTATFTLNTYLLSVSKAGTGFGTVTSNPAGINCGADCSENYNYNTSITLTAMPSAGSTFTGWSGGVCSGTGTCIVTMDTARSIVANFYLIPTTPTLVSPLEGTTLLRTNNTVLDWNTTGTACTVHVWGGSIDISPSGSCADLTLGEQHGGSYSWQVTATNTYGSAIGPIWHFNVRPYAPTALSGLAVSATQVNLNWTLSVDEPADVDSYQIYKNGTLLANIAKNTTAYSATGLTCNTSYSFYLRAKRQSVQSDNSNMVYITPPCPPTAFSKSSPISAINVSLAPVLSWTSSANIVKYEYCIDTVNTTPCANWIDNGTSTNKSLGGLDTGTLYYWQVRATSAFDTTYANGSETAYGSFTTGDAPASFNKSSPSNSAIEQPLIGLTLRWALSNGTTPTTSYEYCYDTTNDNACSTWINNGAATSKTLSTLSPLTTYYWHVRAKNEFGTTYSNADTLWSFTTTPTTTTPYYSTALNDGWTLESSEFSNLASTKNSSGTLRVGDDVRNRQYRSLLYFDTANLPNNAVITKVTVQIKKASMIGDPFATLGNLVADMKKGYFGLSPLELSDFQATAAPINTAGKFTALIPTSPEWYQLTLSPINFKYVNLIGTTQFRLRFTKDDDNDKKVDFISFYAGDEVNEDWKPVLNIEYYVP